MYEIIYDYTDDSGYECRNNVETFEGTWDELQAYIRDMRRNGCSVDPDGIKHRGHGIPVLNIGKHGIGQAFRPEKFAQQLDIPQINRRISGIDRYPVTTEKGRAEHHSVKLRSAAALHFALRGRYFVFRVLRKGIGQDNPSHTHSGLAGCFTCLR